MRAKGEVYVITGPFYGTKAQTIGPGKVWVPTHLYKLVYDATTGRAWAHWIENNDETRAGRPISYEDLVRRTGIEFLPGVQHKAPLQASGSEYHTGPRGGQYRIVDGEKRYGC